MAEAAGPGAADGCGACEPHIRRGRFRRAAARGGVPTAGIRDAEDLPALVEIARFAEGRTGAAELHAYLDRRVALFLGEKETVS